MFIAKTVVVVECDDCGTDWYATEWDEGGYPVWDTAAAAHHDLTGYGWTLTEEPFIDAGTALCPTCTTTRICTAQGHTWASHETCPCGDHDHRTWRMCTRCGGFEPTPGRRPPTPGRMQRTVSTATAATAATAAAAAVSTVSTGAGA